MKAGVAAVVAGGVLWLAPGLAPGQVAGPPAEASATAAHRQRGIAHLQRGDPLAALAEFRAAAERDPRDAVSHDLMGIALGESGQPAAAVEAFREAIRLEPRFAPAHFHLGLALDTSGRDTEAIAAYQEALYLEPALTSARYGLGLVLARLGDREGAIRLLRDVAAKLPESASAHHDLAVNLWARYRSSTWLRRTSDLDEAEEELRKAIALEPGRAESHLTLGQLLARRQRLDDAVSSLRRALALSGDDPAYAYDLGLALRLTGDLDEAEAQLRAALAGDPGNGEARRALGLILRQKGALPAAADELRRSVAARPDDAQGHNVLGTVLEKLDDLPGAIEAFRAATRLEPHLAEARVNLAQALKKAGRDEEARVELAEVRRIKAEESALSRAMVLMEMAHAAVEKDEAGAAVAHLREAASLRPDFAEAHFRLALALERAGAPAAESESAFVRALQVDLDHAPARCHFGLSLARRGDEEAGFQLRRALELAPSLVSARRELGRLAAEAGDWKTAAAELRVVLAWDPDDAAAREALAGALDALGDATGAARERTAARPRGAGGP